MRKALVVGINDYPKWPLRGCINDALSMAGLLARNADHSPNFEVVLLKSSETTITRASLKAGIKDLFAGDPDLALLYFSGHGFIDTLGGSLVTMDSMDHEEGVSMDEILGLANQSQAKDKVIILDCCHAGAIGVPKSTGSNVAQLANGMTILTASREWESAMEINGSGVFTALVVSALQGGAADLRGHITPGSIYAYVDQALGAWKQRPIFRTNVTRFTSLRKIEPPVAHSALRKITQYFPAPQDEHKLDSSYEFTNDPNAPPARIQDPTATEENVKVMKDLQKFVSVGLVEPVGEAHMYYAAMKGKSCRLTPLGLHYWNLVKEDKI